MSVVLAAHFAVAFVSLHTSALGDEVSYRDRQGKLHHLSGEITEYNGQQLTLQTAGRKKTIPSSLVDRVETAWPEAQKEADELASDGQFRAAVKQYRRALIGEKRRWAQRKILADVVWCFRNAGDPRAACATFLQLVADDQDTQYFGAIPLAWQPGEPSAGLGARAKQWLGSEYSAVENLMGASWLLSTSDRAKAIAVLSRLARNPDDRIEHLARTQLWRTHIVQADEERLRQWQEQIDRMPLSLRAGPYYVLGRAHARLGHRDLAALALLRVPILDGRNRLLTQAALMEAARALDTDPSRAEAIHLYQQAIEVDDSTPEAQQAKSRLTQLSTQ